LELSESFVLDTFASPFIDDDLFAAQLGGSKQEPGSIRLYLSPNFTAFSTQVIDMIPARLGALSTRLPTRPPAG
jgi:hypothetical protein